MLGVEARGRAELQIDSVAARLSLSLNGAVSACCTPELLQPVRTGTAAPGAAANSSA